MNKYILFCILAICQYIMDRSTSTCNTTTRGEILLLFHHFFAIYLYLGSFFFNPFIHLIVATLTIIHWYTYNNKCILTEYTNILCEVDINRPFHDYIRMLKIYKIFPNIHWILLFTLIIYDLCLIID